MGFIRNLPKRHILIYKAGLPGTCQVSAWHREACLWGLQMIKLLVYAHSRLTIEFGRCFLFFSFLLFSPSPPFFLFLYLKPGKTHTLKIKHLRKGLAILESTCDSNILGKLMGVICSRTAGCRKARRSP